MRANEVASRVRSLAGEDIDAGKVYAFISELDMRAQIDILGKAPKQAVALTVGEESFELCIPAPFDMAYVYYAAARINFEREEFELYNNNYGRALELFEAYARWYHRNHLKTASKISGLW